MDSLDLLCPHCGVRIGNPEAPAPTQDEASLSPGIEIGDLSVRSGSGDDTGGSLVFALPASGSAPDPLLGALAEIGADRESATGDDPPPGSFDAFGGLNLNASTPSPSPTEPARDSHRDDGEEVVYVDGPNWPMLVLGSYASAVTLALIWWVVIPRFRGASDLEGFAPGRPSAAVGTRRDDRSRKVEPAPPIATSHLTQVGRSLKVGSLEITPIDVARQDVRLRRTSISGEAEERDGGTGALALRVRVRNLANDAVFAPLDPEFLRDGDAGVSASFVEVGPTDRVYLYPLRVRHATAGPRLLVIDDLDALLGRFSDEFQYSRCSSAISWSGR